MRVPILKDGTLRTEAITWLIRPTMVLRRICIEE
jgi:hypothetical protein